MRKLPLALAIVAAAVGFACQADNSETADKLIQIDKRLERMERALQSGRAGAATARRARAPKRQYPDPKTVFSLPIYGAPYKGGNDAKVTVVEAFEFACPWCERVRPTVDKLLAHYGDEVKIAYKNFIIHPGTATIPALAGCAAARQGKFAQMEPLIWDKGFKAGRDLSREKMNELARQVGLDMNRFAADMDGICKGQLQRDRKELAAIGTRGTPSIYINGRFYLGQRSFEGLKQVIDEELTKAKARLAKGGDAGSYYQKWVVERGKKRFVPGS